MAKKTTIKAVLTAEDKTGAAFKSANRNMGGLKKAAAGLKSALAPLAAAASVASIVALGKNSLEAADRISKLSDRLGISTEALSQFKYVAEISGTSFETLAKAIQYTQKNISDAQDGLTTAIRAFDQLHLSVSDLAKMKPADAFEAIGQALSDIEDPARRTQVAMNTMGRAGAEMIQMFKDGAAPVKALRAEADRLGVTLGADMAQNAANAEDAMTRLHFAISSLVQALTVTVAPAITATANFLTEKLVPALNNAKIAFKGAELAGLEFELKMMSLDYSVDKVLNKIPGVDTTDSMNQKAALMQEHLERIMQLQKEIARLSNPNLFPSAPAGNGQQPDQNAWGPNSVVTPAAIIPPNTTAAIDETTGAIHELNDEAMKTIGAFQSWEVDIIAEDSATAINDKLVPSIEKVNVAIKRTRVQEAMERGIRGFGYAIVDITDRTTSAVEKMENAVLNAIQNILDAWMQSGLTRMMEKWFPSLLPGGNDWHTTTAGPVSVAPGSGMPGGGYVNLQPSKSMGNKSLATGGGATVNFNISALDGPSAVNAIYRNKDAIVGVVNDAYNKRGLHGPVR